MARLTQRLPRLSRGRSPDGLETGIMGGYGREINVVAIVLAQACGGLTLYPEFRTAWSSE